MKIKKVLTMFLAMGLIVGAVGCANNGSTSGEFPNKSIEIIVPYAAGGGTDIAARAMADSVKNHISEPLVVVNKTGAGGAVGMGEGAQATADGYKVTTITVELTTLPPQGLLQFTNEDFKPIIQFNAEPAALTVKADAPWNTLEEFAEYAKANPGDLKVGNSGIGAIWHLAALAFEKEIDTTFNHIPYEGANPAVTALLGGHIEAVTVSPAEVSAQVRAGELKILGIMDHERSPKYSDVPTFIEEGYDVTVGTWRGFAVPKNTPADVVKILEDAFTKGANEQAFKDFMDNQGLNIALLGSSDFESRIAADKVLFEELISSLEN